MPEATADTASRREPVIPVDAGLDSAKPRKAQRRSGDALLTAAAEGADLSPQESDDLVDYYLSNDELPGDDEVTPLTVTLGHRQQRTFSCEVHPILWSEWQDARLRATDERTGRFDAFVSSAWVVARALVTPKLGPAVARLQQADPERAPEHAADLLQRMFRRQSGALLELSGKVLEISKLQEDSNAVKEVEAAKN